MKHRTWLVVVVLLVSACSQPTSPARPPSTVIIGVQSDIQSWNPFLAEDANNEEILALIYPSLAIEQVDYQQHPPSFVPSLAETRSQIFVLGDVVRQSLITPGPGLTLLKAIVEAGGPRPELRFPFITLVRGRGADAELFRTPFNMLARSGDEARDILVDPADDGSDDGAPEHPYPGQEQ